MDNTYDKLYYHEGDYIGGIDETGVCDFAGPLVAACVILPKIDVHRDDLRIFDIHDSKETPKKYRKKSAEIIWQTAIAIGIGEVHPYEFDYFGQEASRSLAMLRAVAACSKTTISKAPLRPDFLLVDGELPVQTAIRAKNIIMGDSKSLCVASASIVAKVYRDEVMDKYHDQYPYYAWDRNKGYPSEEHLKGIDEHGIQIGIHRISALFNPPNKYAPGNRRYWYNRRSLWKQATEKQLGKALGDIWMPTNTRRSSHNVLRNSRSSGPIQQKSQP